MSYFSTQADELANRYEVFNGRIFKKSYVLPQGYNQLKRDNFINLYGISATNEIERKLRRSIFQWYGDNDVQRLYQVAIDLSTESSIPGVANIPWPPEPYSYKESDVPLQPCARVPFTKFNGVRKILGLPEELPQSELWKYKLPYVFNKSLERITLNNQILYEGVTSIKLRDASRGNLRDGIEYKILSNGDIWLKGQYIYNNLLMTINRGISEVTTLPITANELSVLGRKISTSSERVRVPQRPCNHAYEVVYEVDDQYNVFHLKNCEFNPLSQVGADYDLVVFPNGIKPTREEYNTLVEQLPENATDGPAPVFFSLDPNIDISLNFGTTLFASSSVDIVTRTFKEYIDEIPNPAACTDNCIEFTYISEPQQLTSADCDCVVVVTEDYYVLCPNKIKQSSYLEYVAGRRTPPTLEDLIDPVYTFDQDGTRVADEQPDLLPISKNIISANPCIFGNTTPRWLQKFIPSDIVNLSETPIISGLMDGKEYVNCYATSSLQNTSSKEYYYDVTECSSCDDSPYFAVSYGNLEGSGSLFTYFEEEDSPSNSIYSQYRLLALDDSLQNFTHYDTGSKDSSDIYVINMYRNSMNDKLDPGNFEICLSSLNGNNYANSVHTGSNVSVNTSGKILRLIDNSGDLTQGVECTNGAYAEYDIVSGSLSDGIHSSGIGSYATNSDIVTYGKVYPSLGIIVLDAGKLNSELNFNTVTGSNIQGDNAFKIFTSMSGSSALGYPSKFRKVKYRSTTNYSVRISTVEANYTNNPTFIVTDGKLKNPCFVDDPVTYITTVGLYNDQQELLAVAKLSKPIKKSFHDQVYVKIRLGR